MEEKKPKWEKSICEKAKGDALVVVHPSSRKESDSIDLPLCNDVGVEVPWSLEALKKTLSHCSSQPSNSIHYYSIKPFGSCNFFNHFLSSTSHQLTATSKPSPSFFCMDNASSKTDLLTPLLLKAGVPLAALSLAALIYAGIIAKRSLYTASPDGPQVDSPETNDSQQGLKPDENSKEDEEHKPPSYESNPGLEEEISGLRSQIEGLQKRESELRLQFGRYCDMKERESLLMQVMNLLSIETARVELLEKEISFMEAENSNLEGFLVQYVRIIERLDGWKSQNRLLRGRLKKLQRKSNAQSRLTNKQALKIKASEAEILENRDALNTRIDAINQIKNEVRELHSVLEQLQNEKNELLKKLDEAEMSCVSKVEALDGSKEEYRKLQKEMEELKKEREEEVKEVIQLRWVNACLRHELERQQDQHKNKERKETSEVSYETEHELDDSVIEKDDDAMACFGGVQSDGACSKKNKLLRRLKRWVEGSDKARVSPVATEKDGHESDTDKTRVPV